MTPPEYPPYTGRFERSHGIDDDQVWSKRNYLHHRPHRSSLVHARRPFYIHSVQQPSWDPNGGGSEPHTISGLVPIFNPACVQHVCEVVRGTWEGWAHRPLSVLARALDSLDRWPGTDPVARTDPSMVGLIALRDQTNMHLGAGVVDLLQWHGVLVKVEAWPHEGGILVTLDTEALDLWAATAMLIASEHG